MNVSSESFNWSSCFLEMLKLALVCNSKPVISQRCCCCCLVGGGLFLLCSAAQLVCRGKVFRFHAWGHRWAGMGETKNSPAGASTPHHSSSSSSAVTTRRPRPEITHSRHSSASSSDRSVTELSTDLGEKAVFTILEFSRGHAAKTNRINRTLKKK